MRNLLYIAPDLDAPTPGQIVEALSYAREIVKAQWGKHAGVTIIDGQRCYCLVAAITLASRTKQIRDAAIWAARMALPSKFAGGGLEAFNDHKDTHAGDVAWLLDAAKAFVGTGVAA